MGDGARLEWNYLEGMVGPGPDRDAASARAASQGLTWTSPSLSWRASPGSWKWLCSMMLIVTNIIIDKECDNPALPL